ncbi:hypothetical protein MCEMSE6_01044 [Oxalobacteraceae bacterium]
MSDDKTNQEVKTDQPKARKILGREEMFDVFKTGGEAELFARPAQKKHGIETETRNGPSINHQIHDANGPTIHHQTTDALGPSIDHRLSDSEGRSSNRTSIVDADGPTITHQMSDSVGPIAKNAEISDASGPTIAHQMNDGDGPIIKKTEIVDANGPTIAHQMSEGVGPIIKKTEITDADGPTINHQMSDANGPVIKRVLENTIVKLPTIPNPVASITKTDVQSSEHQPENSSVSEPAHRVDTFSVHMAERIAKMKSEQKETKTKMDDLEADTQKMQVKLTKK